MVAYSFQRRFAVPILDRTKRQTIRKPRARHVRPGEMTQIYTGLRTRQCRLIALATCVSVDPILILVDRGIVQVGEGRSLVLGDPQLDQFARSDGFDDWPDMEAFWRDQHPDVTRFEGVLIQWGELLQPAPQIEVAHA